MRATMHIHGVVEVHIKRVRTNEGTFWRSFEFVTEDGEFALTTFPADNGDLYNVTIPDDITAEGM